MVAKACQHVAHSLSRPTSRHHPSLPLPRPQAAVGVLYNIYCFGLWEEHQRSKGRKLNKTQYTGFYLPPRELVEYLYQHQPQNMQQLEALIVLWNTCHNRSPRKDDRKQWLTVVHVNGQITETYLAPKDYNKTDLQSLIEQRHPTLRSCRLLLTPSSDPTTWWLRTSHNCGGDNSGDRSRSPRRGSSSNDPLSSLASSATQVAIQLSELLERQRADEIDARQQARRLEELVQRQYERLTQMQEENRQLQTHLAEQDVVHSELRRQLSVTNRQLHLMEQHVESLTQLLDFHSISHPNLPDLNDSQEVTSEGETADVFGDDTDDDMGSGDHTSTHCPSTCNEDVQSLAGDSDATTLPLLYDTCLDLHHSLESTQPFQAEHDTVIIRFTGGTIITMEMSPYHNEQIVRQELLNHDPQLACMRLTIIRHPNKASTYLVNCTHNGGGVTNGTASVAAAAESVVGTMSSLIPTAIAMAGTALATMHSPASIMPALPPAPPPEEEASSSSPELPPAPFVAAVGVSALAGLSLAESEPVQDKAQAVGGAEQEPAADLEAGGRLEFELLTRDEFQM